MSHLVPPPLTAPPTHTRARARRTTRCLGPKGRRPGTIVEDAALDYREQVLHSIQSGKTSCTPHSFKFFLLHGQVDFLSFTSLDGRAAGPGSRHCLRRDTGPVL